MGFIGRVDVDFESYEAGVSEDGSPILGESYFVVMTYPGGKRMRHVQRFNSLKLEDIDTPEGPVSVYTRRNAEEAAQRLCGRVLQRIREGGTTDPAYWVDAPPVYGSPEYDRLDSMGYFKDQERREENY